MKSASRLAVSLGFALVTCLVITGPVYSAMGVVPSEDVESVGIPLAQMARVAALDGDMSESDRSYMNELLPLDRYKEVYHPSIIDPLKWNDDFNSDHLKDGFWLIGPRCFRVTHRYTLRRGSCRRLVFGPQT